MTSTPRPSASPLVRADIAALAGYVPGEQPQGGKWIKLNTNENPYPPSPAVARAIAATAVGRTLAKYPDPLATVFRTRDGCTRRSWPGFPAPGTRGSAARR